MTRANNFDNIIVDRLLSVGFTDYNPFTSTFISERYNYTLDFYEEVEVDSITLGDYIEQINAQKDEIYELFFEDDSYQPNFCFEVTASESFYELRLVVQLDEFDQELADISIDVYDDFEDEDD